MKRDYVSAAVIRRLPRYYRHLGELAQAGVERVSSSGLGRSMGLTASQIRQDLSCFGEFGQQGYGYNVKALRQALSQILGLNRGHTAVIMGAGNLGQALMKNFSFPMNGFQLLAAFDVRDGLVGSRIAGVEVLHTGELENFAAQHDISIGVLTVPKDAAAATAQRLVQAGVKGIWNFTNVEVPIPDPSAVVESVRFSDSLLSLSYLISEE